MSSDSINLPRYQQNIIIGCQIANRMGAVPGLGSIVGAVRTPLALLITTVALLALAVLWIVKRRANNDALCHLVKFSVFHLLVGVGEIVPFIGTWNHVKLNRVVIAQENSGELGEYCHDSKGKLIHPEFASFLNQSLRTAPKKPFTKKATAV